jgi:predicted enzyme related to lactoylglutathione lyase
MNSVVHFEMPYDSRDRVAKFYESAFGWQMQKMGEEMGNYVLATTTESGPTGPKKPGAINGGFFEKKPDWPVQHPSVVIAVDDIKRAIKNVGSAGGAVLGEPMDIPGVGQYVSFTDSEGNRVGMLQPIPREAPKSDGKRKASRSIRRGARKTTASSNAPKARASVGRNQGRVPTPNNCNDACRKWM